VCGALLPLLAVLNGREPPAFMPTFAAANLPWLLLPAVEVAEPLALPPVLLLDAVMVLPFAPPVGIAVDPLLLPVLVEATVVLVFTVVLVPLATTVVLVLTLSPAVLVGAVLALLLRLVPELVLLVDATVVPFVDLLPSRLPAGPPLLPLPFAVVVVLVGLLLVLPVLPDVVLREVVAPEVVAPEVVVLPPGFEATRLPPVAWPPFPVPPTLLPIRLPHRAAVLRELLAAVAPLVPVVLFVPVVLPVPVVVVPFPVPEVPLPLGDRLVAPWPLASRTETWMPTLNMPLPLAVTLSRTLTVAPLPRPLTLMLSRTLMFPPLPVTLTLSRTLTLPPLPLTLTLSRTLTETGVLPSAADFTPAKPLVNAPRPLDLVVAVVLPWVVDVGVLLWPVDDGVVGVLLWLPLVPLPVGEVFV
jgi:hypothetical protein